MEKLTVIYQGFVFVFLCVACLIVSDRNEKTKSFALRFKSLLLVVCAGLTWTRFGKNIFVMMAFAVIGVIALRKRKNKHNAGLGAGT